MLKPVWLQEMVAGIFRHAATTATGVGLAAGCLGTWFDVSHGVVCIPVMTLPPLALSHQVSIGSTVFGVAARQILSASLYALDPTSDGGGESSSISDFVDVNAAMVLASSGTIAAIATASFSTKLAQRPLRKANGVFIFFIAAFMQWRDQRVRKLMPEELQEQPEADKVLMANAEADRPQAAITISAPPAAKDVALHTEMQQSANPDTVEASNELRRLIILGVASGAILGMFGVGPAWILAPVLSATAPAAQHDAEGVAGVHVGKDETIGPSGSTERDRMTSCFAMVPPGMMAAWRHYQLGHIANPTQIALPLATGAILGSAIGGIQLADVECDEELRQVLSIMLFAYGCWSFFKS